MLPARTHYATSEDTLLLPLSYQYETYVLISPPSFSVLHSITFRLDLMIGEETELSFVLCLRERVIAHLVGVRRLKEGGTETDRRTRRLRLPQA